VTDLHVEDRQSQLNAAQTHSQHPKESYQFTQTLGLASPINTLRIMSERMPAVDAAIPVNQSGSVPVILHGFGNCSPALEGFSLAVGAFSGNLGFAIDI
jgi:hypothetical protein